MSANTSRRITVTLPGGRLLIAAAVAVILVAGGVAGYFAYSRWSRYNIINAPLVPPDISFYRHNASLELLPNPPDGPVRNVILMIGDGMGPGITYMAAVMGGGPEQRLHMESMPVLGSVRTHSENSLATDSAAAATALASGCKTCDGMVATLRNGDEVETIMESARKTGRRTGIVVTCDLTDATPASFICHDVNRRNSEAIARDMCESPTDVLLGRGGKWWRPEGRNDRDDLLAAMRDRGFAVAHGADGLRETARLPLLGLFDGEAGEAIPTLPEMTAKAIDLLRREAGDGGFFLMVEGSNIDKCAHKNDFNGVVTETLWFDMAVAEALDFARRTPGTLVVVTADHDTGGVSFRKRHGNVVVKWATTHHTSIPVQIFSYGPGAEVFRGVMDNTDVPKRIARLAGIPLDSDRLIGEP